MRMLQLSTLKEKCQVKNEGPFRVNVLCTNGTVKIQRGPTEEQINIRRLVPFKGTD